MKLGILVVYLVSPENERLLDLHLMQIERYTQVPYTIYGSVNRLLPEFRRKLEKHPQVRICEFPHTDLRRAQEHSYYLEHLIKFALADGVSHLVTLHVDSFPIHHNWAQELAEKITESSVFVTIQPSYTACLFFHRDFYLKYRPTLLLSEEVKASWEFEQYRLKFAPVLHSGVGYGFKAYSEGLSWHFLEKSHRIPHHGGIYENMIFHLGGAAEVLKKKSETASFFASPGYSEIATRILRLARMTAPGSVRAWSRKMFGSQIEYWLDRPRALSEKVATYNQTKKLLNDPETYLSHFTKN